MKIKVLFLLSNFRAGGAETQYANLIKHIDRNKFEPILGFISYKESPGDEFVNGFGAVETVEFTRKSATSIKVIFDVVRYIHNNNIDLVQSLLFMDNQIGRLAALLTRVPVITSVRGELGALMPPFNFWFEKKIQYFSTRIIVNSNWLKSYLVENGCKGKKIVTIYNGIDCNKYISHGSAEEMKKKYGISSERKIISIVARLHPVKDHITFLKTIRCIKESIADICALVAGAGTEQDKLEKYVKDNNLVDNVIFLGNVGECISEVYAMTDVLLLTSLTESFPNVIVESMCSGTPVVSTEISAISEIMKNRHNGFIVEQENYNLFASKAMEILQNDKLKSDFIKNGKETAKKFGVKKMVIQYETLYSNLIHE